MIKLILVLCATTIQASPIELREASSEYKQYQRGSRHVMIDWQKDRRLSRGVSLNLNTDIFDVGYFDNEIFGLMDKKKGGGGSSRFRVVGWKYVLGLRYNSWLDIFYEHTSSHVLDKKPPFKYPIEDSFGFKVFFYQREHKKKKDLWGMF